MFFDIRYRKNISAPQTINLEFDFRPVIAPADD